MSDAAGVSSGAPTGRYSAYRLPRQWYAACFSGDVSARHVIARTVHDVPLVLFRDRDDRVVALLDRCPHRNAPLSLGRCEQGELRCAYHGWRFDSTGACTEVPGLDLVTPSVARRVERFPVIERDGLVWVVPSVEPPAVDEPPTLPLVDDTRYTTVRHAGRVDATVVAAIENALDVPHTAFLHRGLFRGRRAPVPVEVVVRHRHDGVEAHYIGEPVPPGIAARLLAPEGGVVEHVDRFLMPSLSQVEYRLGESHLLITTAFTPVMLTPPDRAITALHATVTFRSRLPAALVAPLVTPLARWILHQDARILAQQQANIRRFGGERFVSTPIDVLGPHINRMLRRAERGEDLPVSTDVEERVTLYT